MALVLRTGDAPPGINGEWLDEGWRIDSFSSDKDAGPAIDSLVQAMWQEGYSGQDVFAVRLAVDEAVGNAIKHGHQGHTSKTARLAYLVETRRVLTVIEDEGPGFSPTELPDPRAAENLQRVGGRGVFLMHRYMTWVRFNDRGNCVTMCKCRSS